MTNFPPPAAPSSRQRPARLLVTGGPEWGHLLPMVPLMRAAATAGHRVLMATGPDMVPVVQGWGFESVPVGPAWADIVTEQTVAGRALGLAPDDPRWPIVSAQHLFGRPAARRAVDLETVVEWFRPDLVVHEPLEFGGALVARSHDIPMVTHGYGPMFAEYGLLGPVVASTAGDSDVWSAILAAPALDVAPPSLRSPGDPLWSNTIELRPSAGERGVGPDERSLVQRRHDRLAYLTLGTISGTAGLLREAVDALVGLGLDVVVTTGPDLDPAELGALPDHVTAARFLPQADVLRLADLVVSQCGAGTMLGALCLGLPQVCLPQGADQHWNAAALAASGAGLVVASPNDGADVGRLVSDAVTEILADPGYRSAARRVQAEIERMPDATHVLPALLESVAQPVAG